MKTLEKTFWIIKTPFIISWWSIKGIILLFQHRTEINNVASEIYTTGTEVTKDVTAIGKEVLIEISAARREILDSINNEIKQHHLEQSEKQYSDLLNKISSKKR